MKIYVSFIDVILLDADRFQRFVSNYGGQRRRNKLFDFGSELLRREARNLAKKGFFSSYFLEGTSGREMRIFSE